MATPLTLTLIPDSAFPLTWVTCTPDAFPESVLCTLGTGMLFISVAETEATLSVMFRLVDLP